MQYISYDILLMIYGFLIKVPQFFSLNTFKFHVIKMSFINLRYALEFIFA